MNCSSFLLFRAYHYIRSADNSSINNISKQFASSLLLLHRQPIFTSTHQRVVPLTTTSSCSIRRRLVTKNSENKIPVILIRRSSFPRSTTLTFVQSTSSLSFSSLSQASKLFHVVSHVNIMTDNSNDCHLQINNLALPEVAMTENNDQGDSNNHHDHAISADISSTILQLPPDIEESHRIAIVHNYDTTYIDPETGYTVFTELAHLKRGTCCANRCRHCPYGWAAVTNYNGKRPKPKVKSGYQVQISNLLQNYYQKHLEWKVADDQQQLNTSSNNISGAAASQDGSSNGTSKKTGGRHGGTLTDKNVPYTRGGDKGTSQLLTGERRSKDDIVFEAMGTVDELCSVTGVIYAALKEQQHSLSSNNNKLQVMEDWLVNIMSRLFDIGSHIAKPRKVSIFEHDSDDSDSSSSTSPDTKDDHARKQKMKNKFSPDGVGGGFSEEHITALEGWIDIMTDELPELLSFILPTGSIVAAQFHVARTVCRRAERRTTALSIGTFDPNALKYLNRLSDFYFTAARYLNFIEQRDELQYMKPVRGAKQRDVFVNAYDKAPKI